MRSRFQKRYEVDVADVERLMNSIVEHAGPDDGRQVERLLAMLTMLRASAEAGADGDGAVAFAAPRDTGELVDQALAAMARSDRHAARADRHRARTAL